MQTYRKYGRRLMAALCVVGVLSACNATTRNASAPSASPSPVPRDASAAPSEASARLADYYARVQRTLLTQGLLRTDGGGADVPFTQAMLARNFERIALHQEYASTGGRIIARESASRLTRWEKPVRISLHHGASVDRDIRKKDRSILSSYVSRLARVTRHNISTVSMGGNFRVYVLNDDERRAFGPELRRIIPDISPATLDAVLNMPRDTYCLVFARDPENTGRFDQAVAIIRAEHPDLMRTACLHEEVAQGLGLSNDSPQARPSIFNDDEEFGLLTTHDEMLLRILYDKRLRPGMTAIEARPLIHRVAFELLGNSS